MTAPAKAVKSQSMITGRGQTPLGVQEGRYTSPRQTGRDGVISGI